ncbi:response regulator [bacterium]|nr:response regulator [bacterium]
MVVDDEPELRENLSDLLGFRGYLILEAGSGAEAKEMVNAHPEIEVILLDIGLPDCSGVDLSGQLKAVLPDASIIMLTAYQRVDYMIASFSNSVYDFLTKPYNVDELVNTVSRALQHRYVNLLLHTSDRDKIINFTVSFNTKVNLLQDLVDRRTAANKSIVMDDIYVFFPELRDPEIPGDRAVRQSQIKDGVLLFIYQLQWNKSKHL